MITFETDGLEEEALDGGGIYVCAHACARACFISVFNDKYGFMLSLEIRFFLFLLFISIFRMQMQNYFNFVGVKM
jgi:hypothetical protein